MIKRQIREKILGDAVALSRFGLYDLAWDRESAKFLIDSLKSDDIGILGGNVYKIESDWLIPLSDNWSCNPTVGENKKEYYLRSKLESLKYIEAYPNHENELILFSIGFTEDLDSQSILHIKKNAEDIGQGWLYCPVCHDAWASTSICKVVLCPNCETILNNPRYESR